MIVAKCSPDLIRPALYSRGDSAELIPPPKIWVAICTKDRAWSVRRCLDSLLPLRGCPPRFEILIVDNAPSDDSTQKLAQSLPGVEYVMEPRAGLDFARNRAVREACGDYLAFLDDDVRVDRTWFEGLERAIRENPDAGAFTGPVLPMELNTAAQILFEERGGFSHGFGTTRFTQDSLRTMTFPCNPGMFGAGCNMVFRRGLLLEIGLFDEALDAGRPLPGGGDLDIFYRVLRAGRPLVYHGGMVVYHQHRREYRRLRHQMWTWGLGTMAYIVKSYRLNPAHRRRFRLLGISALRYYLRMGILSALDRYQHPWTLDLALAELAGALKGLAGEYDRSARRTNSIRATCP
jgi:glycosyltransferase involved in cell wall biosynthesis